MTQSPCTFIERGRQKFLIFDAPNDSNLPAYIEDFRKYHVSTVVRVCDATYSIDPLIKLGIDVHDWPFPDGDAPPDAIIDRWLALLRAKFGGDDEKGGKKGKDSSNNNNAAAAAAAGGGAVNDENSAVAIHCVAGLGRAPVLVSIALIESGMDPLEAVAMIRAKRRGAINQRQLQFLQTYKRRTKDKKCVVM